MNAGKRRSQQGISSIEVGTRLLRALCAASQPQMLKDLAAAAQMPSAKAHRYLVSFMRMGLVEQHSETGRYDLGGFALELGLSAIARLDPVTLAAPALAQLRQETGQTVALAVWGNHGATIVRWLGADAPVSASLRVGAVMPLTRSATGGVFLAWLPDDSTTALVRRELAEQARVGLAPSSPEEVEHLVSQTRRRGYACTSDFIPGICGVAAPVFDQSGSLTLSLVALGYTKPFEQSLQHIAEATVRTARTLSQRLGAPTTATLATEGNR